MELSELVEAYLNKHKLYRFEGDQGLDNLTQFVIALGYKGHGFKHGNPIESFLSDNPGAVEALMTWITEQENQEWSDNLADSLGFDEVED